MATSSSQSIVIVGAGFAGLNACKVLGKSADAKKVQITLIDRRNYHLFQPLLYQVAMAGLSPAEIAAPIRSIMAAYPNVQVMLGNVSEIDLTAKSLKTEFGHLNYDYLILACGAKHSYFGHEGWEEYAPGLKTLEQATEIRRRILLAFELAERETHPERQKELLTFVIVGGGPTGVELAGALGEISRFTLARDFRKIDPSRTRVILIEAGSRLLSAFDESLSRRAMRDLERLGVQIWTSTRVTEVSDQGVRLGNEIIRASTVIWAAGVKPSSLNASLGVPLDSLGRVIVEKDLSLGSHPEVFVLGDQAHVENEKKEPLPGLAPVAIQQGRYVGRLLAQELAGRLREAHGPFRYQDKGQMATIGRKAAVVEVGKIKFGGFWAWLTWLGVHIYYLIGFKNRLFVLFQWALSYFFYRRGARLIVNKEWHKEWQSNQMRVDKHDAKR